MFSQPDENDKKIVDHAMEKLKITHLADRSYRTLNGGEMQLVLIARALAAEPKILIMDEPESNLDFHNQLMILNTIRELARSISCIINTHYPEHALRISDTSLMFMGHGISIYDRTSKIILQKTS